MEAYRGLFVEEAREHVRALADGLEALAEGHDPAVIDALFRAAHSIKGSAATIGFEDVARLAHALEDHLDLLRSAAATDSAWLERLASAVDVLDTAVERLADGLDPEGLDEHTSRLRALLEDRPQATPATPPASAAPMEVPSSLRVAYDDADTGTRLLLRIRTASDCVAPRARLMVAKRAAAQVGSLVQVDPPEEVWRDLAPNRAHTVHLLIATDQDPEAVRARFAGIPDIEEAVVVAARDTPLAATTRPAPDDVTDAPLVRPSPTVRVRAEAIDRLVELMGEVRIAQTQLERRIGEALSEAAPYPLSETLRRLELGVRGLYQDLLDMRTVRVALLLDRFPRLVRELSGGLGKEVRLVVEGRDTTLDRSVVETLADPLVHLVKNALDHGIEPPSEREKAGKERQGLLRIEVQRGPAGIEVAVSDDGRGIDTEAVKRRAIERGIVDAERAERLSQDELVLLITTPGFSTARAVTEVSGRGVGLDVVKTGIERVGGSMRVHSRPGEGTRIVLDLPASLAVMEALEVEAAGVLCYIPVDSVVTSLPLEPGDLARGRLDPPSERTAGESASTPADLLLWDRGDGRPSTSIPVLPLDDLLHDTSEGQRTGPPVAVVLERHGVRLALAVTRIGILQEIVVKRLVVPGEATPLVAGATITSDGAVALILDVAALLAEAHARLQVTV